MDHNSTEKSRVESCYMTYIVLSPTTSYMINSIVGCIVNGVLAIIGTVLNVLVVCVFWKTPQLRHKVSYFTLMLLSSIDLCVTLIVHPFHLVNAITEITATSKCVYKMFYQTSAVILSGMSYLTFFVMNIERYLSIVHPFIHLKHVTKHRCLVSSFFLWLICIGTGIAPIFALDIQIFVTVLALIVLVGTVFIYVSIFYVARKGRMSRLRASSRASSRANVEVVTEDCSSGPDHQSLHSKKTVSFLHDLQLAKMYLLVVFANFLLNLPNAVVLAVFPDRVKTLDGVVQVKIWTLTLVIMNSTANCLIFFWANNRLRNEAWKLCKGFFKS